jgi:hypothetical protein
MAAEAWLHDTTTAFEHYLTISTFGLSSNKDAEIKLKSPVTSCAHGLVMNESGEVVDGGGGDSKFGLRNTMHMRTELNWIRCISTEGRDTLRLIPKRNSFTISRFTRILFQGF